MAIILAETMVRLLYIFLSEPRTPINIIKLFRLFLYSSITIKKKSVFLD